MNRFHEDKRANEKRDPIESSSTKFLNVPMTLLAAFFGFGITYLALRTDHVTIQEGDSRTHTESTAAAPAATDSAAALMERGKQIFTTTCQACHQATGEGIPGTFPPLEGSEWVMGPPKRVAAIILHGVNGEITVKGQKYKNVMPTFQDQFNSEEIAAITTYVRQTFGQKTDTVAATLVDEVKKETKDHAGPWAGEADLNARKWE